MSFKRVVVTGLGSLTPVGNNVEEMWTNLLSGVSGASPITRFNASKHKTKFACEVKNFDGTAHFDRKIVRRLDPYVQYALVAARECMADTGLDLSKEDLSRIGAIVASGIGGLKTFEEEIGAYYSSGDMTPNFSPHFIPKILGNIAAGYLSLEFGLRGPNFSIISACASSTHGIGTAFDMIRMGRADAMLAGGAEAPITPGSIGGFGQMRALSVKNDEYETASRAFSASRDGFVMGEGAGFLMLEELEHAQKRGAKIYAELVGYAASSDAYHLTAPHSEGLGAKIVMTEALKDAGLKPEDVDYINAHGTSTPLGDLSEVKAIQSVFGDHAYKLNISSTKTMTGHLLGAAGAIEGVISVLSVVNDIVPPTINHREGDDDAAIDYNLNFTFDKAQQRKVDVAVSNSFGFGGQNATLVFKKYKA